MKRIKKILLCFSIVPVLLYGMVVYASDDTTDTTLVVKLLMIANNDTGTNTLSLNNSNLSFAMVEQFEEKTNDEEEIKSEEPDIYDIKSQEVLERQKELESIDDNEERFIEYKKLIDEYSEWVDPPETIYDYYTEDEIYLMQKCVETETFQQDFDSKVNVASVILNRINNDDFSNNVSEIIVKGQFAFGREDISEDTVLAIEYAFMFGDTTDGALYFHSNPKTDTFNGAKFIFTDDAGHHFYK